MNVGARAGEDLRGLALSARHARSRERFVALHEIARGGCASAVAERTGRHPQTVMGWLHRYNEGGPEAVQDRRTGGRPPFAARSKPRSVRPSAPLRRPARGGWAARSRRRPEAALDAPAAGRLCAGAVQRARSMPWLDPIGLSRGAPARPVVEERKKRGSAVPIPRGGRPSSRDQARHWPPPNATGTGWSTLMRLTARKIADLGYGCGVRGERLPRRLDLAGLGRQGLMRWLLR